MSNEEVEKIIRGYIPQVVHMSLATCSNNRPWVCEVHFAYDDALNLYFISSKNRRHSQEIELVPFVAGNIVTQHHKNQKVRGVYFEGQAARVENVSKKHSGYLAYVAHLGARDGMLDEISKDGDASLYKITVENYYLFDSYENNRGKFQLPWSSRV
jgi:uncharacterized protein YhbP (UPF0306 family)